MRTKAELKTEARKRAPAMGVFLLRNLRNGRFLVRASRNVHGAMNRLRFELRFEVTNAMNPVDLRLEWTTMGPEAFELRLLDELAPKDAPGWDPAEDLAELEALWRARLVEAGGTPY